MRIQHALGRRTQSEYGDMEPSAGSARSLPSAGERRSSSASMLMLHREPHLYALHRILYVYVYIYIYIMHYSI